MLSAIQFKNGLKKGEPSFVVLPICTDSSVTNALPRGIRRVLEDYQDVMPNKLPFGLPPRRSVDHVENRFSRVEKSMFFISKTMLQMVYL
ncbi:hypothetical protein GQ457_02G027430 [Hibiscus cannabinus]